MSLDRFLTSKLDSWWIWCLRGFKQLFKCKVGIHGLATNILFRSGKEISGLLSCNFFITSLSLFSSSLAIVDSLCSFLWTTRKPSVLWLSKISFYSMPNPPVSPNTLALTQVHRRTKPIDPWVNIQELPFDNRPGLGVNMQLMPMRPL